jgi:hypothetical protein
MCNPRKGKCDAVEGFTGDYTVDFTKLTSLPANEWTPADGTKVEFNKDTGCKLPVTKYTDAPNIFSNKFLHYGSVEVVFKTAPGMGIISSIVLMSQVADEIDWEMSGNNFGRNKTIVQWNYFHQSLYGIQPGAFIETQTNNLHKEYFTYSLDWQPDKIVWKLNNQVIKTVLAKDCPPFGQPNAFPQSPSRIHLGVWSAGRPGNAQGTIDWAGGPTPENAFPAGAFVKSVKIVPQKKCASYEYEGNPITGENSQCKCKDTPPAAASSSTSSQAPSSSSSTSTTKPTEQSKTPTSSSASSAPSSPSSSVPSLTLLTTSTIYSTQVSTITSCAPTVKNCPVKSGTPFVTTVSVAISTTVCPIGEKGITLSNTMTTNMAGAASSAPTTSPSAGPSTTLTLYTSSESTSTVSGTPTIVTVKKILTTTVCPVSEVPKILSSASQELPPPPASSTETAKPAESKPAESKPAESKPAESSSADAKHEETKPAESKPAESSAAPEPSSSTTEYTTSTILSTVVSTITACPSSVPDCPASERTPTAVTQVVTVSTTVCPVTTKVVPTPDLNHSVSPEQGKDNNSAQPEKSKETNAASPEKGKEGEKAAPSQSPTITSTRTSTGTITNTITIKGTGAPGNMSNGTHGGKQKPVTAGAAGGWAGVASAVGLGLGVFFVV